MHHAQGRTYRLFPRGGPGLSCDRDGVALGPAPLARASLDGTYEARTLDDVRVILGLAYGPQPGAVVERCHRALTRIAACLDAGDLAKAGLEAVMIGLPELTQAAIRKLGQADDLRKGGDAWRNEPRIPAGQPDGGQWTTGSAASGSTTSELQPSASPSGQPARVGRDNENPSRVSAPRSLVDDAVYRPSRDRPDVVATGADDGDARAGTGAEPPPMEPMTLDQMFPGLKNNPGLGILNAVTHFLGVDEAADGANLDVTLAEYRWLVNDIHSIDPHWFDEELLPTGGIAALSWDARNRLIDDLRMKRAVLYYRIKRDPEPLQVETIRFLQREVDFYYAFGKHLYEVGGLNARLSPQEAIGNFVDEQVRERLKAFFGRYGVPFGAGQQINVNTRNYISRTSEFRIPDSRIVNLAIDWTLAPKTMASAQVRGFLRADAQPTGVVIIRPSQMEHDSPYLIPRPYGPIEKVTMPSNKEVYIPKTIADVDDSVSGLLLHAPTFRNRPEYVQPEDLETTFYRVNEGLKRIRSDLGDELYERIVQLSDKVKALFTADPVDEIGATRAGGELVRQMQDLLRARAREIGWTPDSG